MPDGAKICVHCGEDCSQRPRVKDAQGRYACKACLAAKQHPHAPSAAVPAAAAPADDAGDIFAIAEPPVQAVRASAMQPCPKCSFMLPEAAVLCTNCGHSLATGKGVSTRLGAAVEVGQYSADPRKAKREREKEKADARMARNQYVVPVVLFVVGTGAIAGLGLSGTGATTEEASQYMVRLMVGLGIYSLLCTLAYLLCCALWLGLNTALHVVVLQMLGVVAMTSAAGVLLGAVHMGGIMGLVIRGLVCAGLMVKVMDIDAQDAILAAVLSYLLPAILISFVLMAMIFAK